MQLNNVQIKPRDIVISVALFAFVVALVYSVGKYVGSYKSVSHTAVSKTAVPKPAVPKTIVLGTGQTPVTALVSAKPTLTLDSEHFRFHTDSDGRIRIGYAVTFPSDYQWEDGGFIVSAQAHSLGHNDDTRSVQMPGTTHLIAGQARAVSGVVTVRGFISLPAKRGTYPVSFGLFTRDWKKLLVWYDNIPVTIR